jgi:hypothetical protein
MKVTLKSGVTLGNKKYPAGTHSDFPTALYANVAFQKHVKSGLITVHPKSVEEIKAQASLDQRAVQKAQGAKKSAAAAVAARAQLVNNKSFGGVKTSQADKAAAADAAAPAAVATVTEPAPAVAAPVKAGKASS